jgi:HEAT repeat protein
MKTLLFVPVVLLGLAPAVRPALAQTAPAGRAAAEAAIRALVSERDTRRAYEAYDRFVVANVSQDAGLLGLIAAEELRAIAQHAADDPRLQVEALERLARHGDSQAPNALQRMAVDRPGTPAAALADGALARLGDTAASARLLNMASSNTLRDKSVVVESIRRSGLKAQAQVLVPLLKDEELATRLEAIDAVAALDYKAAIPEIRPLLSDENPQVRSKAALALKRLGDPAGNSRAQAMLRSDAGSARLEALEADPIADRNDKVAEARRLMNDPDPLNRVKGAEAIAGDEPAAAHAVLKRVADDPDSTARRLAARSLEFLKPADLALLRRLLEDSSGWVRMYAAGGVLNAAEQR